MRRYTKQIRKTLGLLSSMIRSGENHSKLSEKSLRNSLNGLEQLDLYIVSNSLVDKKFMGWLAKEAPEINESLRNYIHKYETNDC